MSTAFPECRQTSGGTEYRGHVGQTAEGATCVPWDELNIPQLQALGSGVSLQNTEGSYCRNPDPEGRPDGVWCFVGEGEEEWAYCDVPRCKGN